MAFSGNINNGLRKRLNVGHVPDPAASLDFDLPKGKDQGALIIKLLPLRV